MTEMRAGRSLSLVPGLTTLYAVTPGEDRKADVCIGMVATTELAELIVAAVNGEEPQLAASDALMEQRLADVRAELERRIKSAERAAAATERARLVGHFRDMAPVELLRNHGLRSDARPAQVLAAVVAEIGRLAGG